MNCSTPGLPVHHQLPESTQTHVCSASDAIQPSHPLSSPSPPYWIGLPQRLSSKEFACNAEDTGDTDSIPGSGRSPGGENGNPLQCSCLKIPWTEEPGGMQSMGSQRVRHNCTQSTIYRMILKVK